MTKDEKIKKETEVVKSRSTRHALERVLKAVQLHLPPDGISEREAIGRIIEAVDPMPDDFDSEKCIKEVMELVDDWSEKDFVAAEARLDPWSENAPSAPMQMIEKLDKEANDARKAIESKLRELIQ